MRSIPVKSEREALAEVAGNVSTNSEATMTGDELASDAAPPQKASKPRECKGKGEKKIVRKAGKHGFEIKGLEDEVNSLIMCSNGSLQSSFSCIQSAGFFFQYMLQDRAPTVPTQISLVNPR